MNLIFFKVIITCIGSIQVPLKQGGKKMSDVEIMGPLFNFKMFFFMTCVHHCNILLFLILERKAMPSVKKRFFFYFLQKNERLGEKFKLKLRVGRYYSIIRWMKNENHILLKIEANNIVSDKSGWGPRNKFGAQLHDSLGSASNLEKIFCSHIGNYTHILGLFPEEWKNGE